MELEMTTDHQEQMVSFSNKDATHIAKGKRTKRFRLLSLSSSSPCGAAGMSSSCSSAYSAGGDYYKYSSEEEEEEDMANCLILLAQGGGGGGESSKFLHDDDDGKKMEKGNGSTVSVSNRKLFSEITTATNKAGSSSTGLYIYECKTCNRTFSSFQALGGHRASHKKPKLVPEEKKPSPSPSPPPPPKPVTKKEEYEGAGESQSRVNTISVRGGFNGNNNINKVAKIHECSICGSEFSSGQALGGHMRRHRATANIATAVKGVPQRNILELDLNLPAPEDDIRESMFHQFPVTTQKSMVLSVAPALVDCHY